MHRIHLLLRHNGKQLILIQIRILRGTFTQTNRHIGLQHMQRIPIRLSIHRNRLNTHLLQRAHHPHCNGSTIGNKNFFKHNYCDGPSRFVLLNRAVPVQGHLN